MFEPQVGTVPVQILEDMGIFSVKQETPGLVHRSIVLPCEKLMDSVALASAYVGLCSPMSSGNSHPCVCMCGCVVVWLCGCMWVSIVDHTLDARRFYPDDLVRTQCWWRLTICTRTVTCVCAPVRSRKTSWGKTVAMVMHTGMTANQARRMKATTATTREMPVCMTLTTLVAVVRRSTTCLKARGRMTWALTTLIWTRRCLTSSKALGMATTTTLTRVELQLAASTLTQRMTQTRGLMVKQTMREIDKSTCGVAFL